MKSLAHPRQPILIVQTAIALNFAFPSLGLRYVELVLSTVAITMQDFVLHQSK